LLSRRHGCQRGIPKFWEIEPGAEFQCSGREFPPTEQRQAVLWRISGKNEQADSTDRADHHALSAAGGLLWWLSDENEPAPGAGRTGEWKGSARDRRKAVGASSSG